ERFAKHARQLEADVVRSDFEFTFVLRQPHGAAQAGGARRSLHRCERQVIQAGLQRIFRRALGTLALELERDFAESAGGIQCAQPSYGVALGHIREERPQSVQYDSIGLAAGFHVAVGRLQPLSLDAGREPRGSGPRHVQIRYGCVPRVAGFLRAQSESETRIAEHCDRRDVPSRTRILFPGVSWRRLSVPRSSTLPCPISGAGHASGSTSAHPARSSSRPSTLNVETSAAASCSGPSTVALKRSSRPSVRGKEASPRSSSKRESRVTSKLTPDSDHGPRPVIASRNVTTASRTWKRPIGSSSSANGLSRSGSTLRPSS